MDIVVEATLVVEASWLPEFAAHLTSVVPVEKELRDKADGEQADCVGLATGEEAPQVAMVLHVTLVGPHLQEAVD